MRALLMMSMLPFVIHGQTSGNSSEERPGPSGLNFQLLASNGFYNIKAVEGRTSSGPQLSTGFMAGLGGEHFRIHIGYFYTQDRFELKGNPQNITGPRNIFLKASDVFAGLGYTVIPQKRKKNYSIEFIGGIASTYISDNSGYFDLSGTSKNPFNGHRDSIKGFSSYVGMGSSIRIKGHWSFRINAIHRRYEFKLVEGIRNTPVNIQLGLCYGLM